MIKDSIRHFDDQCFKVESIYLMQPAVAIEYINYCKNIGVTVLGLDGFLRFGPVKVQPQLVDSFDVDMEEIENCHQLSIDFIRDQVNLQSELWFEVVTDEPWLEN